MLVVSDTATREMRDLEGFLLTRMAAWSQAAEAEREQSRPEPSSAGAGAGEGLQDVVSSGKEAGRRTELYCTVRKLKQSLR